MSIFNKIDPNEDIHESLKDAIDKQTNVLWWFIHEKTVIEYLLINWVISDVHKLPQHSKLDFLCKDRRWTLCAIEIKRKKPHVLDFPWDLICKSKIEYARELFDKERILTYYFRNISDNPEVIWQLAYTRLKLEHGYYKPIKSKENTNWYYENNVSMPHEEFIPITI